MHESLTFNAGLRVLTGDVGPHASCVLPCQAYYYFYAAGAHRAHPPVLPTVNRFWNCGVFHRFGTHVDWCRLLRLLINKEMTDVTSGHCGIDRAAVSRQSSGLSLPCCRCFAWTSPAASQPAGTTGSRCLSDPWRSRRWFPDLTKGHIKRRINSTIKCSFLKICIRKYNMNSSLFPLWCWSRCRLTDSAWLVLQRPGLSAGAKCSTITA